MLTLLDKIIQYILYSVFSCCIAATHTSGVIFSYCLEIFGLQGIYIYSPLFNSWLVLGFYRLLYASKNIGNVCEDNRETWKNVYDVMKTAN